VPGKGTFPPPGPCPYNPATKGGVAAVTYRSPGTVWSEYHTLLCPFFLGKIADAPKFNSLKNTAKDGDSFPAVRATIDRWSNTVRAVTIFHETTHWQDISWPTCDGKGEIYAPEKIVSRSRNDGSDGYEANLRNAHSWTLAATAMWMMERWSSIGVPQPRKAIPATVDPSNEPPEEAWGDALDTGCKLCAFLRSLRRSIHPKVLATLRDHDIIMCSGTSLIGYCNCTALFCYRAGPSRHSWSSSQPPTFFILRFEVFYSTMYYVAFFAWYQVDTNF